MRVRRQSWTLAWLALLGAEGGAVEPAPLPEPTAVRVSIERETAPPLPSGRAIRVRIYRDRDLPRARPIRIQLARASEPRAGPVPLGKRGSVLGPAEVWPTTRLELPALAAPSDAQSE